MFTDLTKNHRPDNGTTGVCLPALLRSHRGGALTDEVILYAAPVFGTVLFRYHITTLAQFWSTSSFSF